MPADDPNRPTPAAESTAADTFSLIGNETRAEIIQALGDSLAPTDRQLKVPFSELQSELGTGVDSTRLNYHLNELVGQFVEKTDDGYHLRPEGLNLYWTIRGGTFDQTQERQSTDAEFDCYYCDSRVEAATFKGLIKIECPECEFNYVTDIVEIPLDRFDDDEAAFTHFSKFLQHKILGWANGICSTCGYETTLELIPSEEKPEWGERRSKVYVYSLCEHCGEWNYLTVGMALLNDPELISFCYDHGVDLISTPVWKLRFAMTDGHLSVRSTDPWEVALQVTYGDETMELVVDGDVNIVERNRS